VRPRKIRVLAISSMLWTSQQVGGESRVERGRLLRGAHVFRRQFEFDWVGRLELKSNPQESSAIDADWASVLEDRRGDLMPAKQELHRRANFGHSGTRAARARHCHSLSPRGRPNQAGQVLANGAVEREGERTAGRPPGLDLLQHKPWTVVAPILMRDRISPSAQVLELPLPSAVPGVQRVDLLPERHAEPREVASEVPWIGIALI
jgi:hypothetical protein